MGGGCEGRGCEGKRGPNGAGTATMVVRGAVTDRHWRSSEFCTSPYRRNRMNVALWIVAGLLALVLLVSSIVKLFVPKEKLNRLLQHLGPPPRLPGNGPRTSAPVPSRPSESLNS
jgi:hypothetical protein